MSYSRFGKDSNWYVYWLSKDVKKIDDEILIINYVGKEETKFTYEHISKNKMGCLMVLMLETGCCPEERDQVSLYMDKFRIDVEKYWEEKNEKNKI